MILNSIFKALKEGMQHPLVISQAVTEQRTKHCYSAHTVATLGWSCHAAIYEKGKSCVQTTSDST